MGGMKYWHSDDEQVVESWVASLLGIPMRNAYNDRLFGVNGKVCVLRCCNAIGAKH